MRLVLRRRTWFVVLTVAALLLDARAARADDGARPPGWIAYDDLPQRQSVLARIIDGVSVQPLIKYLTDCDGLGDAPDCGGTPARWPAASVPVLVCSTQSSRPASVGAQEFRDAVSKAVATWNAQEIAVGINYTGDCANRDFWLFNSRENEIGWDDQRQVLSPTQAAVTRTSIPLVGGIRIIRESDIVLDPDLARLPRACLDSTIVHEFGHLLGLGHSDDRNDLMYPSFDPANVATCKAGPSTNERERMQALYGVDRNPLVTLVSRPIEPSTIVVVVANGSDPEGGLLTYRWQQTAGPAVVLQAEGATVRFLAPPQINDSVALRVTAIDHYGHTGTATASFIVNLAGAPPGEAPSLEAFRFGGGNGVLGWSGGAEAATYELCGRSVDYPADFECAPVAEPSAPVSWDTILGAAGRSSDYRLITTGARETFLRGCNSKGCSIPGTGGLSGGLRWDTWGIDYDYFALAYDVGTIRFTIVGVVNVSGEPRSFVLGTGPASAPGESRLIGCGVLPPGQVCFGFMGPSGHHGEYVDILAQAADRPTIEHRIRVR